MLLMSTCWILVLNLNKATRKALEKDRKARVVPRLRNSIRRILAFEILAEKPMCFLSRSIRGTSMAILTMVAEQSSQISCEVVYLRIPLYVPVSRNATRLVNRESRAAFQAIFIK